MSKTVLVLVALLSVSILSGTAEPVKMCDEIPRIALIGDSWTGFMWAFRSFHTILPDYPGCDNYIEVGASTAVMGARAFEMLTPERKQSFNDLLTENPTVDVIVMTLGGNDFLRGTYPDPSHTGAEYEWECPGTANEHNDLVFATIKRDVKELIEYLLSIRPDIRVVIAGYTYGGRNKASQCDLETMQRGFVDMEMAKQEIATELDRVEYVNNFGLMQWNYGVYYNQDPDDPFATPPDIPAQDASIPYPSMPVSQAAPGGLPQYFAPYESLFDNDIHLTEEGYDLLARRLMDEFVEEWLNYPKCFEILPLDSKTPVYQFQVTFSEDVSNVDVNDFLVTAVTKGGRTKAASVLSVNPAAGPAAVYTVTVDMDGMAGVAAIQLQDNDTITDGDTIPLGGAGAGNGDFTYNGELAFSELPIPEDDDFTGSLRYIAQQTSPYEGLIGGFSFSPEKLDANGELTIEAIMELINNYEEGEINIPRNGLLEDFEFALIRACLLDENLDFSSLGGASHAEVAAAWATNITQMQEDLGGPEDIAAAILPGLDTFLAGLITLGDSSSTFLVTTLMGPLALGGADLQEQFPINITTPNLANYVRLPELFAWDGDADGDGYVNADEYVYFSCDGREGYADAALNPSLFPRDPNGLYETGESLRIAVYPEATDPPANYPHILDKDTVFQWYRNGEALSDGGMVSGATERVLNIVSLTESDSGVYTCIYDEGDTKAPVTYGPVYVTVGENVPAPSGPALLLIAMACILTGAITTRRRYCRTDRG